VARQIAGCQKSARLRGAKSLKILSGKTRSPFIFVNARLSWFSRDVLVDSDGRLGMDWFEETHVGVLLL
jgi:hypothetical protein